LNKEQTQQKTTNDQREPNSPSTNQQHEKD
jgi:hypothetical protein